jgi:release factor glutamine methyltransferase
MPVPLSGQAEAEVTAALRAAGCVYAEEEARLLAAAAGSAEELATMVSRRAAGQPLEHVAGWAEFCGLRMVVSPGVFVPRRRTEFLVAEAAALLRQGRSGPGPAGPGPAEPGPAGGPAAPPVVVDLCCGCGALGAALAAVAGPAEVHAVDIDPAAVRCAQQNLAAAGGHAYLGDLDAPLPPALRARVAVLLANVPYVPSGEIALLPAEAREHEARAALDGGPDGLAVFRRVAAVAPGWLAPGAALLTEVSDRQVNAAAAAAAAAGLAPRIVRSAELDATVLIATRPAAVPGSGGGSLA